MPLMRTHDWAHALHTYLHSNRNTPFKWGVFDCCLFVAGAIEAMTGTKTATDFGTYTDQTSALAAIKKVTGGSTALDAMNYVATKFSMKALPSVLFAQRGDVVTFTTEDGSPALGVVYLNGIDAVFVSDKGLNRVPVKSCTKAWRGGN